MILISHRGNTNLINAERENTQEYIDEAITKGYDVEIDVYGGKDSSLWLGHDLPERMVELSWLKQRKESLWIHCKNVESLCVIVESGLRCFFHEKEKQTIIGNTDKIWTHDIENATNKSIIPLITLADIMQHNKYPHVFGICSDYVELINGKN